MTNRDPADPASAGELRSRIKAAAHRFDKLEAAEKKIRDRIGKIKYHAGRLINAPPEEASLHRETIDAAIKWLEDKGIPSTDRRIAEAVGPDAAAVWPKEATGDARLARVINRALSLSDADKPNRRSADTVARTWSDEVLEVRHLLHGRRLVIIGGKPNADAKKRLEEAFDLQEAEWVELTEHGSGAPMRAPINRTGTALVLVIIKLAGHLHTEEARKYSDETDIPCVMLPAGYNPERVAAEILSQASDRLRQ